jgi:hypothetical protein
LYTYLLYDCSSVLVAVIITRRSSIDDKYPFSTGSVSGRAVVKHLKSAVKVR